jgi:integrase
MSAIAKPTDEKSRERVLKDAELSTIWRWLDSPSPLTFEEAGEQRNVTVGPTMASALRLAMLLPHRRAEVAGITGDEVDLSNSLWEVPEWRTKARKAHIVPLPPRSHELIKAALDMAVAAQKKWQKRNPDQAPGASVPAFPSPRDPRKSITAGSLSHAFNDLMKGLKINDATLHDLRRTASTNLTKAGFSEEIVGRVLTHAHEGGGSRVTQIYNRHAYLPEKQEALAAWEKILLGIVACSDPAQSNGNSAHISQEL